MPRKKVASHADVGQSMEMKFSGTLFGESLGPGNGNETLCIFFFPFVFQPPRSRWYGLAGWLKRAGEGWRGMRRGARVQPDRTRTAEKTRKILARMHGPYNFTPNRALLLAAHVLLTRV
ncbi:uncharacterized protein LOC143355221 [Halictus rubicundus]|uniref:uncharacterized protein LOC143355221 n=1 Tax=Halictus rubicundus TaxID=77578 RepID=UPI004036CB76